MSKKLVLMFVILCLVLVGLYFGLDTVTGLKIFPNKINSGTEYLQFAGRYGNPVVLVATDMKLVERNLSVIPGPDCSENINTILGENRVEQTQSADIANEKSDQTVEKGMIDKIFEGYTGYVANLEKMGGSEVELAKPVTPGINVNGFSNGKSESSKTYRADVYESKLLVYFKMDYVYRIVILNEKYYKCSFPSKAQFYTYSIESDDAIMYFPEGVEPGEYYEILKMKIAHDKWGRFESWREKRSRSSNQNYFRLYKFSIPTQTTCMLLNDKNVIVYGDNLQRNETILALVEKLVEKHFFTGNTSSNPFRNI